MQHRFLVRARDFNYKAADVIWGDLSAPSPHSLFLRHWLVSVEHRSLVPPTADPGGPQPIRLSALSLHSSSRPRSSLRSLIILIFSTMHSFTTLAVLALAASTVSPVLSAPVRYGGVHFGVRGSGTSDGFIFSPGIIRPRLEQNLKNASNLTLVYLREWRRRWRNKDF